MQVVVAPREWHGQIIASLEFDGSLSGELRRPLSDAAMETLHMGPRKIIAHRCMLAIDRPHAIVNLGAGMPEVPSSTKPATYRSRAAHLNSSAGGGEGGMMWGIQYLTSQDVQTTNIAAVVMTRKCHFLAYMYIIPAFLSSPESMLGYDALHTSFCRGWLQW
jgi:acyl CoA:acetate/3-ketoacid CoA transferase